MNEAYLSLINLSEQKANSIIEKCTVSGLIKGTIFFLHKNRKRKGSNLDDFIAEDLNFYNEKTDTIQSTEHLDYALNILKTKRPKLFETIEEILDEKKQTPTGRQRVRRARIKLKEIYGTIGN